MEMELEPRVKPLPYKVKAMSRESPSQKGANVLDSDLRTHWSTATNNKEWILLELEVSIQSKPPLDFSFYQYKFHRFGFANKKFTLLKISGTYSTYVA